MAKTNAELQQAYRQRSERVRLDVRIDGAAKRALERLATQQGAAQHEVLNELLLQAERDAAALLGDQARADFYACKPPQNITG